MGLGRARAAMFCISRAWTESTWCEDEFNGALQERRADRRYRVVGLLLDDCDIPSFLKNAKCLEMRELTATSAAAVLDSLIPDPPPWVSGEFDVYMSRSWHEHDSKPAHCVCRALIKSYGFRLVGDAPDYPTFGEGKRQRHIIESCGGLVAVLPFRNEPANGCTSRWIVEEVEISCDIGRPYILFAADGIKIDDRLVNAAIGGKLFPLPCGDDDAILREALGLFQEEYRRPPRVVYSFFATSLREEAQTNVLVDLMEQVTGMECVLGQRMGGQHVQREIVKRIKEAEFVMADISYDHRNSLIEAGIARGAGTRLHLICKPPDSGSLVTRFMFRDFEVNWYSDALERVGVVHRIARMYRRQIYGLVPS
jgi:hypothetical protein